jgi:hypothetical protein
LFVLRFVFVSLYFSLSLSTTDLARGQDTIPNLGKAVQISGHYWHVNKNGAPGITNYFHFVALTATNGWRITTANDQNTNDWGLLQSDGTNLYLLASYGGGYNSKVFGCSFPGQFYTPEIQDSVHLFMPWLSFYFTPELIVGKTNILRPWGNALFAHSGFGFKWILTFFPNTQTIREIQEVRDKSLDLATSQDELRCTMANYPFNMSDRETVVQALEGARQLTNGYNVASFEYGEILPTNNLIIPTATGFVNYWPAKDGVSRVQQQASLKVDNIVFLESTNIPQIVTPAETLVSDYRYQMANSRTKFNYATYTLSAGDTFKPGDDPVLLAQARHWLKYGPGYNAFKIKRGMILAGMMVVSLVFLGALYFRIKKQTSQTNNIYNT